MGWDNPPISWREFERRLSWRQGDEPQGPEDADSGGRVARRRLGPRDGPEREPDEPDESDEPDEPVVPWAELHCHSWYSFLDGASEPKELITEATSLGLSAIAITDHDGMYGIPQFAQSATRLRNAATAVGATASAGEGTSAGAGTATTAATVFGAELGLTRGIGRTGVPDPAGNHLV